MLKGLPLESLDLSFNSLYTRSRHLHASACAEDQLAELLPHCKTLIALDLRGNRLGHGRDDAEYWDDLAFGPGLLEDGPRSYGTGKGLATLAPALQQLPRLASLDVSQNELGPAGAAALIGLLREMPSLTCVGAKGNRIKGAAARKLRDFCVSRDATRPEDAPETQVIF